MTPLDLLTAIIEEETNALGAMRPSKEIAERILAEMRERNWRILPPNPTFQMQQALNGTPGMLLSDAVSSQIVSSYRAMLAVAPAADGPDPTSGSFGVLPLSNQRIPMPAGVKPPRASGAPTPDPIVAAVCADLLNRSEIGIAKYGTTLARTDLGLKQWLEHAYQEALDHALYLKRAMAEMGEGDRE